MLRILLIITLLFYVLYKFGFFRALSSGYNEGQNRRPPNGNVNVDSTPQKEKKRSDFKGGDYVDYEEIK
ncbi:MAG: hypothetical protein WAZ98_08445 [Cyclobacteriaceae bacterium]